MTVIAGSGDAFADLGFSDTEARNLRMRSQLMTALLKLLEKESLTQAEAAKRFQVTRPRISDLMRGKISRFPLDALIAMTAGSGMK